MNESINQSSSSSIILNHHYYYHYLSTIAENHTSANATVTGTATPKSRHQG